MVQPHGEVPVVGSRVLQVPLLVEVGVRLAPPFVTPAREIERDIAQAKVPWVGVSNHGSRFDPRRVPSRCHLQIDVGVLAAREETLVEAADRAERLGANQETVKLLEFGPRPV